MERELASREKIAYGNFFVQAILDQKKLTGLAGGVREGQYMAQNGPRLYTFLASEPSRDP